MSSTEEVKRCGICGRELVRTETAHEHCGRGWTCKHCERTWPGCCENPGDPKEYHSGASILEKAKA